jgi:hypothetical protein
VFHEKDAVYTVLKNLVVVKRRQVPKKDLVERLLVVCLVVNPEELLVKEALRNGVVYVVLKNPVVVKRRQVPKKDLVVCPVELLVRFLVVRFLAVCPLLVCQLAEDLLGLIGKENVLNLIKIK